MQTDQAQLCQAAFAVTRDNFVHEKIVNPNFLHHARSQSILAGDPGPVALPAHGVRKIGAGNRRPVNVPYLVTGYIGGRVIIPKIIYVFDGDGYIGRGVLAGPKFPYNGNRADVLQRISAVYFAAVGKVNPFISRGSMAGIADIKFWQKSNIRIVPDHAQEQRAGSAGPGLNH